MSVLIFRRSPSNLRLLQASKGLIIRVTSSYGISKTIIRKAKINVKSQTNVWKAKFKKTRKKGTNQNCQYNNEGPILYLWQTVRPILRLILNPMKQFWLKEHGVIKFVYLLFHRSNLCKACVLFFLPIVIFSWSGEFRQIYFSIFLCIYILK